MMKSCILDSSFIQPPEHNLTRHVNAVHEGKKEHICGWAGCGKAFADKRDLTRHVNAVHEGKKRKRSDGSHRTTLFANKSLY